MRSLVRSQDGPPYFTRVFRSFAPARRIFNAYFKIIDCEAKRVAAIAALDGAKTHPVSQRWLRAEQIACVRRCGHTWEIIKPWVGSLKPRTAALPQVHAMSLPEWPDELRFSNADREVVVQYPRLVDNPRRADAAYISAHEQHRQLLAKYPELKAAS
jgi:hypothetical protein